MTAVVRYDAMRRAIATASGVEQVKDIRDRVAALEYYAREGRNIEAARQFAEIRLRAEYKAGELLHRSGRSANAGGFQGGDRPAGTAFAVSARCRTTETIRSGLSCR
jgi:hypothetical protein